MRLRKPSPAMLVALLALFVALGGSSYAALQLPKNSVGGKQLKKNSVTSPKVKRGSLLLNDFRASQRSRLIGPQGPQGAQGPQGPPGPSNPNADTLDGLDSTQFLRSGAAAGGALSGTFPNPGLADSAVTGPKLAANAVEASKVADGSLRIADLAVWTEAGNIGGTTNNASACNYFNFGTPTGALPSDLILVQSDVGVPAGLALSAVLRPDGGITGGTCNFTTANIALPNPFVLRIHGLR